MSPIIALFACLAAIFLLIIHERNQNDKCSFGLWVAISWFFVLSSRPVGAWIMQNGQFGGFAQLEEGSLFNQIFDSIIIISSIGVLFQRNASIYNFFVNNKVLFFYFLYCGISISWSDYQFVSFKRYVRAIGNILVLLVVLSESDVVASINKVIRRCAIIFIPLSYCLYKYFPEIGRDYYYWTGEELVLGAAGDKNALGRTCMIFGIFYIWSFLYELKNINIYRDDRAILIHFVLCVLLLWLLFISNSATAVLCFIIGILILMAFKIPFLRNNTKNIGYYISGVVILIFFLDSFFNINEIIVLSLGRNITFTGRDVIWKTLLNMGTNPWVGTGFESFWLGNRLEYIFNKLGPDVNEAHNGYLDVYLNLGVVGIILVGALLYSIFNNIRNRFSYQHNFSVLGLVFLIVFILYNVTESSIRGTYFLWSILLLVGIDYRELE